MQRPTILFIASWWPHKESPFGGLFIQEHAKAIATMFDVHVVHLNIQKASTGSIFKTTCTVSEQDGMKVYLIDIRTRVRRFGIHDFLVKRAYSSVLHGIVKTHAPIGYCLNVRTHLTRFVPYLSMMKNLPFIHIEHFSYYHTGIDLLRPAEQKREETRIKKWFANPRLKKVLPVSEELGQILQTKFGAPESKLATINNIANTEFKFRPFDGVSDGKILMVCVALWNGPKRPKLLLEAMSMLDGELLSQLSVVFIGEGKNLDEAKEYHKAHVARIDASFVGFQYKEKIAEYFTRASFFVHPTDSENAPTVISEALCSGLPVLSMRVNGIPEMVNDEDGILVKPNDPDALKDGIEAMLNKLASFDRQTIAAKAAEKYSAQAVGDRLIAFINEAFA